MSLGVAVAYRVDELAEAAGVTVQLIRSYQTKGLLDPPRHDGRVALYSERHLERLRRIAALKAEGYSLKAIAGLLDRPRAADRGRAAGALPAPSDGEHLDIHELAERTHTPLAMLRSLEASGVVRPRQGRSGPYYTAADVRAVRMLLTLLGAGVPMEDFLALAARQIATMHDVAAGAVDLYRKYVGEPLRSEGLDPADEEARAEAAFGLLVQASTGLVAYSFERMLRAAWASGYEGAAGR